MKDPRFEKLSKILVEHSLCVQPGQYHMVKCLDSVPRSFVLALSRKIREAGGIPVLNIVNATFMRESFLHGDEAYFKKQAEMQLPMFDACSGFATIVAEDNDMEMSGIPPEKFALNMEHYYKPISEDIVMARKWCVLKWPTSAMAQKAGMSTEVFEDFYFSVCADVDYKKMSKDMDPLVELMNKTDKVHIIGPGDTNLKFSIKGIGTVKAAGECNIPDGEAFTASVPGTMHGIMHYNTPTIFEGKKFENIRLIWKNGVIVSESCEAGSQQELTAILDRDEGARKNGEFAIAVNPLITEPMCDNLFDEKIAMSFHNTPGRAYEGESCDNGNRSKIHWDLVAIQSKEKGGGEIWFDDVLVRKNGLFVLPELQGLNP